MARLGEVARPGRICKQKPPLRSAQKPSARELSRVGLLRYYRKTMVERELGKRFGAFAGVGVLLLAGCGGSPKNDIDAPDIELISVFYPVDGLVLGLGQAGAMPPEVDRVSVQAFPTNTSNCVPLEDDGSFTFSVVAIDNDVLEISGAIGEGCAVRGAPAFTRVPESPLPPVDFVCCFPTGTCQSKANREEGMACPEPATGVATCEIDAHCGVLEGEYLDLAPEQIVVGQPDANGRVSIEGRVGYPGALVRVRNLGLSPLGFEEPSGRYATITDQDGNFMMDRVPASGDDELAVQLQDLNGFKSPPIGKRVPDAALAGVDIVGVYAYQNLEADTRGQLAVHLSPYGVDNKGICPDGGDPEDWICHTGGVTHSMVETLSIVEVTGTEDLMPMPTEPVPGSVTLQYTTGVVGDVRSASQDVIIVLDLSQTATPMDVDRQIQIEEVKRMIDQIRARDRVGAVVVEDWGIATRINAANNAIGETGLHSFQQRDLLKAGLDAYIRNPEDDSVSDAVQGLTEAGLMLRRAGAANGRIVMLIAQPPGPDYEDAADEFAREELYTQRRNAAFDAVVGRAELFQVRYPTNIIGLGLENENDFSFLQDISDFSRGRYWPTTKSAADLRQTLTDVQQELAGSFILLYDIQTPCTGKSMTLNVSLSLAFGPEQRADAQWSGPVRIAGGCPNGPGGN
jgi:hypothetical protein